MHDTPLALIALAGFAAGAVNALAGGGTLISFPVLLAAGLPAVTANATSTIALCPGFLGATLAQRSDLRGQGLRLLWLLPAAAGGGLLGAMLLLRTGERAFANAVPWLILIACVLLALQERLRAALISRSSGRPRGSDGAMPFWLPPLVAVAAIYGGYFGAGMSVIVLAVLGLALEEALPRLNGLKQVVALSVNGTAALWLAANTMLNWTVVAALGASALVGGVWGGRVARRMSALLLRRTVVLLGLVIAAVYLWRLR